MEKIIENVRFDEERALYGFSNVKLVNVHFDGDADGESAVKECRNIVAENCYCNLRYPFWHVKNLKITESNLTQNCRAALWYSENVQIFNSRLNGIKAVRECQNVLLKNCQIGSPEFGWLDKNLTVIGGTVAGEYLFLQSGNVTLEGVNLNGKYSFQYVNGGVIKNCNLTTKDAFWHSNNITVINSVVRGEYLGWYSKNLTFINCVIIGTQPLCYCKGLKLVNCKMQDCDLAFEKSEAVATITSPVISVKNFYKGKITLPAVGEIIKDDKRAKGVVVIK